MKQSSFRHSFAYTCLAIMLEAFHIDKTDVDIMNEMRMPYLFDETYLSKTQMEFIAGPKLQGKRWYDLFLNRYQLEFVEETVTKKQAFTMLENLSKFKRKALLEIKIDNHLRHVVFETYHVMTKTYQLIMPQVYQEHHYKTLTFDQETLLDHLSSHVTIGFINPTDHASSNLVESIESSIRVLDNYKMYIDQWCANKHAKNAQQKAYENVFHAFVVDVRSMMKLKENEELYDEITTLSHRYAHYLKSNDERFDIPLNDAFNEAITHYQTFISDYLKRARHHLSS